MESAINLGRVHTLECEFMILPEASLIRLLESPSLSQLQCLTVACCPTDFEAVMELLIDRHVAHLKKLHFASAGFELPVRLYPLLRRFSALTDLGIRSAEAIASSAEFVAACPKLTRLTLAWPAEPITALLQSDIAPQLESLSLSCGFRASLDTEATITEWSVILSRCSSLTSLTLIGCAHVIPLVTAALRICTGLQRLHLNPPSVLWHGLWIRRAHVRPMDLPTSQQITAWIAERRTLAEASSDFAPMTIALTCLSQAEVASACERNATRVAVDWHLARRLYTALVRQSSVAVRFELIDS